MKTKNLTFINKVLFASQINKIKSPSIKQYWQNLLLVKNILIKIILFFCVGIIVCSISFGARQIAINYFSDSICYNPGISFSIFQDLDRNLVYLIQIVPCIIAFLIFIFLTDNIIIIGFLMIFFGGLCNIIDRALPPEVDKVTDYIPLGTTVVNLPDIFISTGAGVLALGVIIFLVKSWKDKNDDNETTKPVYANKK